MVSWRIGCLGAAVSSRSRSPLSGEDNTRPHGTQMTWATILGPYKVEKAYNTQYSIYNNTYMYTEHTHVPNTYTEHTHVPNMYTEHTHVPNMHMYSTYMT